MQLILQLLALSSDFDKVFDFFQLISTACFEPAGIVKDKSMSCWELKLVSNIMFSALENYIESIMMEDVGRPDTDRYRWFWIQVDLSRATKEKSKSHRRLANGHAAPCCPCRRDRLGRDPVHGTRSS